MTTQKILNQLPTELKNEVMNILTCYDKVIIDFENGKYKIGSYSLREIYPSDFKQVGIINNFDVYSKEEIEINYKNM